MQETIMQIIVQTKTKLAFSKKQGQKISKFTIKKYLDKVSIKIILPPLKSKTLESVYKNCSDIINILEIQKNNAENKKLIDLVESMYLLAAFKYSKYQIYNNYFIVLCKRL